MPVPLAFALLITFLHLAIYFTSVHSARIFKAFIGVGMSALGFMLGICGHIMLYDHMTGLLLTISEAALPLLSLLVYLPSWWQHRRAQ